MCNRFAKQEHSKSCPEGCYETDRDDGWVTSRPLHTDETTLMIQMTAGRTTAADLINALTTLRPGSVVVSVDAIQNDDRVDLLLLFA